MMWFTIDKGLVSAHYLNNGHFLGLYLNHNLPAIDILLTKHDLLQNGSAGDDVKERFFFTGDVRHDVLHSVLRIRSILLLHLPHRPPELLHCRGICRDLYAGTSK